MANNNVTKSLTIKINGKEIDNSITKINKEIRQLRKNLAAANNPADRKKYNAELEKGYQARRKINEEIRGTQSLLQKVKKQLGPVGTAMAGAFSIGIIMNFAGQVIDTIKLFRELKQETKLLTDLTGEMLDQAVAGTKALADTFETGYKENLQAANTLVQNFGVSYQEALEIMEKGYLAGANVSGDMLEQIKEYAPKMKEANIEMDEMVALIAQTQKAGIFNDKGIDTIGEAMVAIREGTDAVRNAMDGLGIDTKQVYKDLEEGNTDYFEVMQLVSAKMAEFGDQSTEVGVALADIFKGAGEDAGTGFTANLAKMNLEIDELIDNTDEYTRLKQEEIDVNIKLNETWTDLTDTGGFFNQIAVTGKSILADILAGFRDLDKMLADSKARDSQTQLDQNESDFRDHMERMKKTLGDRYDFEEIKINYVKNIGDGIVQNQILALDELEVKTIEKTKSTLNKIDNLQKEANEKKASAQAERDAVNQQKKLEKLRENEEGYEALQRQLKDESDQRTFELEEENRLEEEAQRLEQEILNAETEEERTQLIIERAQYIATQQLEIEQRRDIERAKLAGATEAEIFAIKQKYLLAEQAVNIDFSKAQAKAKDDEVEIEQVTSMQKLDVIRNGLNFAATLFDKQSTAYKAIKISETLITAYQSGINTYNSLSSLGPWGIAAGIIAAAAAVANGLKQVQNIKNTQIKKMPRYAGGGPTHTGNYSGGVDGNGGQYAVVHPNEYMIPEFVAQDNNDPAMPAIMQYLETKRIGQSLAEGGAVETSNNNIEIPVISSAVEKPQDAVMEAILFRLNNPLPSPAFFDNEQASKVNDYQTEVEQARNGAIIA